MRAGSLHWAALVFFAVPAVGADPIPKPPTVPPTAWEIYEILHTSCVECHGGHLAKPKGKLGYILDLERLVSEAHIIPGDPENSDLYLMLVSTDEEEKMPPPDAEGPPPTAHQIEAIRAWIEAGARIGNTATDSAGEAADRGATGNGPLSPVRILGRFHPVVIHFPIALLMCACATELLSRGWRRQAIWLQATTRGSLWLATLGAMVSVVTGWLTAAHEGFASEVDVHRWLGLATTLATAVALGISEWTERRAIRRAPHPVGRTLLLFVLLVSTVLVFLAGHTGGQLVWGEDHLGLF